MAAIGAGACVLLALGCGLLGLAVQQRVIAPGNIAVQLGPLGIVARAPRPPICPEKADPLTNVCDRFSAFPAPASYRIWIFWSTPAGRPGSARVLAHWVLPLRDTARS